MGWHKRSEAEIAAALADLEATVAALDDRIGGRSWRDREVRELRERRRLAARAAWKIRHANEIRTYHREYNRCLKRSVGVRVLQPAPTQHRRRITPEQADAVGALAAPYGRKAAVVVTSCNACHRCGGPLIPDLDGAGCLWCGNVVYEREEAGT